MAADTVVLTVHILVALQQQLDTVRVLHMNAADRVQLRKELQGELPSQLH